MSEFTALPDLARGGAVTAVTDEFFGPAARLLDPADPVAPTDPRDRRSFDGWMTRRRRVPGEERCVVRLAVPGIVAGVTIDASHAGRDLPDRVVVEGSAGEGEWIELTGAGFDAGASSLSRAVTPVWIDRARLRIEPDGGVARLRIHGTPLPYRQAATEVDLVAAQWGASVVVASDDAFGTVHDLLRRDGMRFPGDGWMTRRRREPGTEWAVVALGTEGTVVWIGVDTESFPGDAPAGVSVEAGPGPDPDGPGWFTLVHPTAVEEERAHGLRAVAGPPVRFVRLRLHPDGGVTRFRVHGRPTPAAIVAGNLRRFDHLPVAAAEIELRRAGVGPEVATRLAAGRPYGDPEALLAAAPIDAAPALRSMLAPA